MAMWIYCGICYKGVGICYGICDNGSGICYGIGYKGSRICYGVCVQRSGICYGIYYNGSGICYTDMLHRVLYHMLRGKLKELEIFYLFFYLTENGKCSKMLENVQKCWKMFKNVENRSQCSNPGVLKAFR